MRFTILLGLILTCRTLAVETADRPLPTAHHRNIYSRRELPPGVHHLSVDRTRHHRRSLTAAGLREVAKFDRARTLSKYQQHWVVWNKSNSTVKSAKVAKRSQYENPFDSAKYKLEKRADELATAHLTQDVSSGIVSDYFSGDLEVGTPVQHFPIDFDTGSSDLFVPGPEAITKNAKFEPKKSSTYQSSNLPFAITYGSGASGILATDTVTIGSLSAVNHTFAVVNSDVSELTQTSFSGILGMGFPSIAASKAPPFHVAVADQLASKVFSFHLATVTDETREESGSAANAWAQTAAAYNNKRRQLSPHSAENDFQGSPGEGPPASTAEGPPLVNAPGGSLLFGGIDSSLLSGDPVYQNLIQETYWEIQLEDYSVGGQRVAGTGGRAILDSGTTLIYLPTNEMAALAPAIGAVAVDIPEMQGMYAMPCASLANIDLSLSFGGKNFPLDGANLNLGAADEAGTQCLLGIAAADALDLEGQPMSIVGDAFLSSYYSIYDFGQSRVGLAKLSANAGNDLHVDSGVAPSTSARSTGNGPQNKPSSDLLSKKASLSSSTSAASGVSLSLTNPGQASSAAGPASSDATNKVQSGIVEALAVVMCLIAGQL